MKTKILSLVFILCGFYMNAQTTPVKIIDFTIVPEYYTDTIIQNDTVVLNVIFKTKNAIQANKAWIYFGTVSDASDVKFIEANFINTPDTAYISYAGIVQSVIDYSTYVTVKLTQQQYNLYAYATLFLEDINGLQTERLYFQKQ